MKIGIDIDDTICDTFTYILPALVEHYNLDSKKLLNDRITNNYDASKFKNYNLFATLYYPKIIPYVPLIKDAKKYINKLNKDNEIYFITARSSLGYNDSYEMTYNYLVKNGFLFTKLIINASTKAKACKNLALDFFIDDSIINCLKVQDNTKTKVILFGNIYNTNNDVLKRIDNWKDIYDYIINKND